MNDLAISIILLMVLVFALLIWTLSVFTMNKPRKNHEQRDRYKYPNKH